jgi:quinol monooxygenase YgiN
MSLTLRNLLAPVLLSLGCGLAFAQPATPAATPAPAMDSGPAYIVTYIEVAPAATAKARGLVSKLAKASRNDAGSVQFVALQRIGAPNHFALLEVWKDKDAQAAHGGAAHTKEFREQLLPLQRAPYDERPHSTWGVGPMVAAPAGGGVIYAVTHVDIVPTSKDIGLEMTKVLAEQSRKDAGNLRFDALQQNSRPNHVTLVEAWKDQKAVESHGIADHMKEFRNKFSPLSGSLYDERLYKVIN